MKKFEVYQLGKLPPLTVVEADDYFFSAKDLIFYIKRWENKVAMFNWNNIAGFKEVKGD